MSLDPTARKSNYVDSIKKFFKDGLKTGSSIDVLFDRGVGSPDLKSVKTDRWVMVNFGYLQISAMSEGSFDVVCCTRRDKEYYRLHQLRDTVMELLSVNPSTSGGEGRKSIDFYNSLTWIKIGGILIFDIIESAVMDGPDGTNYCILTVFTRFGSNV